MSSASADTRFDALARLFDFPRYQLTHCPLEVSLSTKIDGKWVSLSSAEFVAQSELLSLGLMELGLQPGDKVALISHNNRYEWNVTDIGVLQAGGVDVPIYATLSDEDVAYILNHSESRWCFVSNDELWRKVMRIKHQCPQLEAVYCYLPVEGGMSWTQVLERGRRSERRTEFEERMAAVRPSDLATIIYTSGTTGVPKGVMLSHSNLATNSTHCHDRIPVTDGAIALSFLPVCHVYERMLTYLYCWKGIPVYHGESLDTVGDNIREIKPHIFTAVPRLLEKVFDRIMLKGSELTGVKRALFFWAVGLAERYDTLDRSALYNVQLGIARKLIFSKWLEALGGRVVAVVSGSAALNPRLARIFLAAGVNIQEGYGLTETSPVISVNGKTESDKRIGCVGRPIANVEVRIAEDGEILCKGPNVMMGYYKNPELTAEIIDAEGWFHTGDIGTLHPDGHLQITDRKKEIFKTSGGKYVAPQMLENALKESRFIEQIMVIGEGEKHPAALVQPDFAFLKDWCDRKKIPYTTPEQIIAEPRVKARIEREVNEINKRFGQWEQIKKIELTPDVWSIDSGHLTPTLKLKRRNILKRYTGLYERIYEKPYPGK
ncbi:AMP-binding protein [bacterium]|nr:AMP-binding protein [bacterium]